MTNLLFILLFCFGHIAIDFSFSSLTRYTMLDKRNQNDTESTPLQVVFFVFILKFLVFLYNNLSLWLFFAIIFNGGSR